MNSPNEHASDTMKSVADIIADIRAKLSTIPDKKQRMEEGIMLITMYGDTLGDRLTPILEELLNMHDDETFEAGKLICELNIHFFSAVRNGKADQHTFETGALQRMLDKIRADERWYAFSLHLVAFLHWFRGDYEKAFSTIFDAIRLSEGKEIPYAGWQHFALAVFYFDTRDFENANTSYRKAHELFSSEGDHYGAYGMARACTGMGTIAVLQDRLNDAEELFGYASDVYRKLSHHAGLSRVMNDLGTLEIKKGNTEKAIRHFRDSIALRREIDHLQGLATSYTELGEIYLGLNRHQEALEQFRLGLEAATLAESTLKQIRLHKLSYETQKKLGHTELALFHFEKFFQLKTQLLSDEAANNIKKIQARFEREKAERETELERIRNTELEAANAIITAQNTEIEARKRDIIASISYARRIQYSVLPQRNTMAESMDSFFVMYQPKDIVSGDFYWFHPLDDQNYLIICADCTGHGVPGSMMTVIGASLLNRIVAGQQITKPSEILQTLDRHINQTLRQQDDHEHFVQDGMDLSLLQVNKTERSFVFCSAKRPGIYTGPNGMQELPAGKYSLGGLQSGQKEFEETRIDYSEGSAVYLFTDGCTDQFGGPGDKKFSSRRLREALHTLRTKPAEVQLAEISDILEKWRGNHEQTDDMLLIGILF